MLVLSRYIDESIVIGNDIEITVVNVGKNGVVRLGINAPKDISVFRKEVFDKRQQPDKKNQPVRVSPDTPPDTLTAIVQNVQRIEEKLDTVVVLLERLCELLTDKVHNELYDV